jgi:hypothetical protein
MLPAADVPFQLGCCHRIKILSLFGKGNAQLVVGHFDHPFGFTLGNSKELQPWTAGTLQDTSLMGRETFSFIWGEHARAVNGPLPSELVLKLRRRRTSLLSFKQNTGLITAIGRIETAPRGRRLVWPDKMCGFSQKA